jgi:8-oxo-dGTP pyrophosphatase MutT (NUDIX family)
MPFSDTPSSEQIQIRMSNKDANTSPPTRSEKTQVRDPGDSASQPSDNDAQSGTAGRYVLLGSKGRGGQSDVYLARDPQLLRLVAIKFLLETTTAAEERIKREAQILATLNHPGICHIYDIGSDPVKGTYLVLEYLDGRMLDAVLQMGQVDTYRAVAMVRDIAAVLTATHGKGIIHRDLKPENIAVLPDGRLKIFDFGLARAGESRLTRGVRVGTPAYMSPEQHDGFPVSIASDIFSLGIVFYELVSGTLPFDTSFHLRHGVYKELEEDIVTRLGATAALLTRMLDVNPVARPTAAEIVENLDDFLRSGQEPNKRKTSGADTAATVRFLELIPAEDQPPVAVEDLAEHAGLADEAVAHMILQLPLTFGAVRCEMDEESERLMIVARSEVARYFLKSLSLYVQYGLTLIDEWEIREDPAAGDALCLLGPDFVYAMEHRRVFQYGFFAPIRIEYPSQVVIKAFDQARGVPVYLMQYDRFARQFQLIGGRRRGDETPRQTMDRELVEELAESHLVPGVDYELTPLREDIVVRELSRTVGAYSEYHFSLFFAEFNRPLTLTADDRWVTEAELFSGQLEDGARAPFNSHLARVVSSLDNGLAGLRLSLRDPVGSPTE